MDSLAEIFLERANNEILAAESLMILSENAKEKVDFKIPPNTTFYSSVISHSYYAIFYAAKSILLTKNIKTYSPGIHKKTYSFFDKLFVKTGILDAKLLEIYEEALFRAIDLLEMFKDEKWKRGNFTYNIIPQANKSPAEESLSHARLFVSHISKVIYLNKNK